jgi:hypothetical protein
VGILKVTLICARDKGKIIPVHTVKIRRYKVHTFLQLHFVGRVPQYSQNRRLDGAHSQSAGLGEEKK